MRPARRWLLMAALAGLLGSACHQTGGLAATRCDQGRQAFARGEVLRAYALLREIPTDRQIELAADFQTLLAQVTKATEHLVERWLDRANGWLDDGQLPRALRYFDDLIGQLPEQDALRNMLVARATPVRERLAQLRAEQAQLMAESQLAFHQGRIDDARQKLLEARWLARENNLEFDLALERLLEECDRRLPGRLEEIQEADAPESMDPVRRGKAASRDGAFRKPRPRPPAARPKPGDARPEPPLQPSATQPLMVQGRRQLAAKQKIEAILTFRRVLALDPDHPEATQELSKLEPFRLKKIADWMRKAAGHFAREELELAAPYYQKVLELDPDNLRAKEGQQMYQRLKELRSRQK